MYSCKLTLIAGLVCWFYKYVRDAFEKLILLILYQHNSLKLN